MNDCIYCGSRLDEDCHKSYCSCCRDIGEKAAEARANASQAYGKLQAENKRLKEKAKIIQVGNVPVPEFDPTEKVMGLDMSDPKIAYLCGWEGAVLECGEILSKP